MTNKLAIYLGVLILAVILADQIWFSGDNALFLSRKFVEFIEWLAFWR